MEDSDDEGDGDFDVESDGITDDTDDDGVEARVVEDGDEDDTDDVWEAEDGDEDETERDDSDTSGYEGELGDLHQTIKRIKSYYMEHNERGRHLEKQEGGSSTPPLQLGPSQEPIGSDWSISTQMHPRTSAAHAYQEFYNIRTVPQQSHGSRSLMKTSQFKQRPSNTPCLINCGRKRNDQDMALMRRLATNRCHFAPTLLAVGD
ncbi:hypothetical protein CRG98_010558 [Punica granatum]|uniref:Uncharacterized protein n=1 Tax=Punica granatum TaxID=22663 RepID=A0A2I0KKX1_PUNGR|nr:hypothetical protein CRG98_010558 [Punica granatum]